MGLSPRVRGKRGLLHKSVNRTRSIPACAGEAARQTRSSPPGGVYPRVCGGSRRQSSPTMTAKGLSPRVRGKPWLWPLRACKPRSIPACAGEARGAGASGIQPAVYPRVCGGSQQRKAMPLAVRGLSPRVRGKQHIARRQCATEGSIPACAGEAWPSRWRGSRPAVYPRVCGGSIAATPPCRCRIGLSPRVRGKRRTGTSWTPATRSIPACAGEARSSASCAPMSGVYPRVCGGSAAALRR